MLERIQDSTWRPLDAQFAEMVGHAQAGDTEAIGCFIQHFEGPIYGYIRKQIGNDTIAKDLYDEVVEKVLRGLPKTNAGLHSEAAAKKWFFKIATHRILDYFEICTRLPMISLENLEQRFKAGDPTAKEWYAVEQQNMKSAEEVLCNIEETTLRQNLVTQALEQVPGQLRACFYMRVFQERSYQEIAKISGIQESTARAYVTRGRQAFLEAINRLRAQQEGEYNV